MNAATFYTLIMVLLIILLAILMAVFIYIYIRCFTKSLAIEFNNLFWRNAMHYQKWLDSRLQERESDDGKESDITLDGK